MTAPEGLPEDRVGSRSRAPDWSLSAAPIVRFVRKGAFPRVMFAALMAALGALAARPEAMAGWALAVIAWELLIRPRLEDAVVLRPSSAPEPRRMAWLSAIHFVGACLYSIYPVLAWLALSPIGMLLATVFVCASANHAFVYFSANRLLLTAVIAPLVAAGLAAPFAGGAGFTLLACIGALALVGLTAIAGLYGFDRRMLLQSLAQESAARKLADEANASKSRFLTMMTHELRTPLNAVIGYAEIIEEDAPSAIAEDARQIQTAARKLLAQIATILDVAKLNSDDVALEARLIEVGAILRDVESAAKVLAQKTGNSFTLALGADLGEARLDMMQTHKLVMELIDNAMKVTKAGQVRVEAARARQEAGDVLSIAVTDTGPGLAPDMIDKVFEPFDQSEGAPAHDGIGLFRARLLARLMGGDIACESRPGAGATFTVTLPLARAA